MSTAYTKLPARYGIHCATGIRFSAVTDPWHDRETQTARAVRGECGVQVHPIDTTRHDNTVTRY